MNLVVVPHDNALLLVIAAVVVMVGLYFLLIKISDRVTAKTRAMAEKVRKEDLRIAALPKLDTTHSVKVPDQHAGSPDDYQRVISRARTFAHRNYRYVLVYDPEGVAWLGFLTPEIIENLRAGEYVERNYVLPLCGNGELEAGEPIYLDGYPLYTYPNWMTEQSDIHDLYLWMHIGRRSIELFTGKNREEVFRKILPAETIHRIDVRRRYFENLRTYVESRTVRPRATT
jgi:hypothetical protein